MRKLDRASVPVPACLQNVPDGLTFKQLGRAEKDQIRDALHAIQAVRCAYCERRTGTDPREGHIEHLRCQADHPELDLDWGNLFWSCNDENSCGKFKDGCVRQEGPRGKFNASDLIDPSVDDPDDYLLFVTDGTVRLKEDLDENGVKRGRETLRVFNISECAYLRKAREDAVLPYVRAVALLQKLAPQQVPAYVASEQAAVAEAPFSAAIRQFFRDYL